MTKEKVGKGMTTDLEQEFYDTFGIETRCIEKNPTYCCDYEDCDKCRGLGYPQITDHKLLEMICIYSKYTIFCLPINAGDFEEKWTCEKLKNYILKELICLYKANIYNTNQKLQSEIQQLFDIEEINK